MTLEILTLTLIGALALILSVYHHKQTASLRSIEQVAQDYYAMHVRAMRRAYAGSLDTLNPFTWISARLPAPLSVSDVIRVLPEAQAVELRASGNRRVVISTQPYRELYAFDRRARHAPKGDRLAAFAARPLLPRSRFGWGAQVFERVTCSADEFFDLEADVIGKKLGVDWNHPTRLFFYVLQ